MSDVSTETDRFRLKIGTNYEKELLTDSAIDPEVAMERGYLSLMRPKGEGNYDNSPAPGKNSRQFLQSLGFPGWAIKEDYFFPGLWIPGWDVRGQRVPGQWKPNNPVPNKDGRRMKYASARGRAAYLDVHPRWTRDPDPDGRDVAAVPAIKNVNIPLYHTEGIKKADALTSRGICTVALSGVFNWRNEHGALGDWEDVRIKGREHVICFDADTTEKLPVQQAMIRFGRWLKSKGAAKVEYLVVPAMVNGIAVKGVDDYFAAGGTITELERAITDKPPRIQSTEDTFTDSALAERAVAEALSGRYANVVNVGWYGYDGRIWEPVPDAVILEAIREWARDSYRWALQDEMDRVKAGKPADPFEADAWRKAQSAGKLGAILKLASGNMGILKAMGDFDTWHDLLNTPAGVIDLTTLDVMPHDPAYLFTKMTKVNYKPGTTHEAFTTALEAVPAEARDYLQLRLGQAITGYEPDDDKLVLFTGGGANGKTTLMQCFYAALGGGTKSGYSAAIPNTLLMKGSANGAATPEKMTLQGVRLGYMEETPEGKYLDSQTLKEVIGTPTINGRKLFKDYVEFGATHSLFLNTNFCPQVAENGEHTWRRLLRLDFPYTFVPTADRIEDPAKHRLGDASIKVRLRADEALEAALAWMVEGTRRWHEGGRTLQETVAPWPTCIAESTLEWRHESDILLRYLTERFEFATGGVVASSVFHADFKRWAEENGHLSMSNKTLMERLSSYDTGGLPGKVTVERKKKIRFATAAGFSMPPAEQWKSQEIVAPAQGYPIYGLRFQQ